MGGSRRGTQRVTSGGLGMYSVGRPLSREVSRFWKSICRGGTSAVAESIMDAS